MGARCRAFSAAADADRQLVRSRSEVEVPFDLRPTLCETRDALHVLRKTLFVRGHAAAMEEIDTLIGLAQDRATQAIGEIDRAQLRTPILAVAAGSALPAGVVVASALPTRLGELSEQGMGLSIFCANANCGHLRSLDMEELVATYGTHYDFTREKRLASKLICKRCRAVGGRLVVVADERPRY